MMDVAVDSQLYKKTLGCLVGGLIGDAIGTPTENMAYGDIEAKFGWVDDFEADGTDDTVMKNILADALVQSGGYATIDDWGHEWVEQYDEIFGDKVGKFFQSVLHTAAKLRRHAVPRMAALGNMPSSSSAMCISPVGVVNACNPRAAAFAPGATRDSVVDAAVAAIVPLSGAEMRGLVGDCMEVARKTRDFKAFRAAVYARRDHFCQRITCDSRETIPLTVALFWLAEGDVERSVTYGANFGRDADTIASMAGAIAGALQGIESIRSDWVDKALRVSARDQEELACALVSTALAKMARERAALDTLRRLAG